MVQKLLPVLLRILDGLRFTAWASSSSLVNCVFVQDLAHQEGGEWRMVMVRSQTGLFRHLCSEAVRYGATISFPGGSKGVKQKAFGESISSQSEVHLSLSYLGVLSCPVMFFSFCHPPTQVCLYRPFLCVQVMFSSPFRKLHGATEYPGS